MIHLRNSGFRSSHFDICLIQCHIPDHVTGSHIADGIALQLDPFAGLIFHVQPHGIVIPFDLHRIITDILTIIGDRDRIDICQLAHIRFRYDITSAQLGFHDALRSGDRHTDQIAVVQDLVYFSFFLQEFCIDQTDLDIVKGNCILRVVNLRHQEPQYKSE